MLVIFATENHLLWSVNDFQVRFGVLVIFATEYHLFWSVNDFHIRLRSLLISKLIFQAAGVGEWSSYSWSGSSS